MWKIASNRTNESLQMLENWHNCLEERELAKNREPDTVDEGGEVVGEGACIAGFNVIQVYIEVDEIVCTAW